MRRAGTRSIFYSIPKCEILIISLELCFGNQLRDTGISGMKGSRRQRVKTAYVAFSMMPQNHLEWAIFLMLLLFPFWLQYADGGS